MPDLSTLQRVDLREVWPNEASDFTPWLAKNIEILGEVLGLELEVETREASVGPFSLDVLARDLGSNQRVVIENQLNPTDHDHLGKLMTYAAGFDASVVVWLVREFRPEHRAALDWLNHRTGEDTAFFGVAVEAWRIDGSRPAPHFVPVAVPNDWQKRAHESGRPAERSERSERYRAFFQTLIDELREEHGFTKARKGQPQNWYQFASGHSGIPYNVAFTGDGKLVAGLTMSSGDKERNEQRFDRLAEHKEAIESEFDFTIQWDRRDDIQACFVQSERGGTIDEDDEQLEELRHWIVSRLLDFKRVFVPYMRQLVG